MSERAEQVRAGEIGGRQVIRTVLGDVPAEDSGVTLFHEHLISNWSIVSGDVDARLTDPDQLVEELQISRGDGLVTLVDASTPDVPGRDARVVQRIAADSGVNVIIGAGLYREPTYPPGDPDTAELTETFCRQVEAGVSGTDIRAGVLGELGTSPGGPTDRETRVLQAAAQTQARTSVGIITHTMEGQDALLQLSILEAAGADPGRVVIGHLDCLDDVNVHLEVARRGAFVGFDRIGIDRYQSDQRRAEMLLALLDAGYQDRILLSSDLARISRLHDRGGEGYSWVLRNFHARLSQAGVSAPVWRQLLTDNPRRLLAFSESKA